MSRVVIRSYRAAWHLERRIYKVGRGPGRPPWRIPWPGGLPLLGVGYWFILLVVVFVFSRIPVVSMPFDLLSWPMRYGALPVLLAVVLSKPMTDGRSGHRVALSRLTLGWTRWRLRKRWAPVVWSSDFPARVDVSWPALVRARVWGPARVRFTGGLAARRGRLVATSGEEPVVVVLGPGEPMEVRP